MSSTLFLIAASIAATSFSVHGSLREVTSYCSDVEAIDSPCSCCKIRCWYDVSSSAKVFLGHVPGTRGEGEVMATLMAVKKCYGDFCPPDCQKKRKKLDPAKILSKKPEEKNPKKPQ